MKNINSVCFSLFYDRLLPPLLFFLKHAAYYAFTHEISDWNKYLSQKIFPVCLNWATLSSITYVENSTSNFRQFIQICCREEEREYWQMQIFLRFTQTQKLSKLNWNILLLTLSVSGSFYIKYLKRASGFLISIRLSN